MTSFFVAGFPIFVLFAFLSFISVLSTTLCFFMGVYKHNPLNLVNKIALVGTVVFFVIFASFAYRGWNEMLDNQVVEVSE
jgi:hypothetical protein